MKVSVVIPVLNSHEIVRRQLLRFDGMNLFPDVEVVLVDDGSDPPLNSLFGSRDYLRLIETGDFRPWTHPKARNIGCRAATGDTLIITDIDHIVSREAVAMARSFREDYPYDYGRFRREFGALDQEGRLTQDVDVLEDVYGLPPERITSRGLKVSCHTLSMMIRREVFEATGGFRENLGKYPTHDDGHMKRSLKRLNARKLPDAPGEDLRPLIYVFPNGRFCGPTDYNPEGLFHSLSRT